MKKGIFITATGTDVGKTYVSALLVKQIREYGLNCGYYKPVLSGAVEDEKGNVVAGDAKFVCDFAGLKKASLDCVSYVFKPAVSPHLASEMSCVEIDINKIVSDFAKNSSENEFTVVEGAGGIICPLNLEKNLFMYDLPRCLDLGVIVVADGGLGTINNTFLTIDFLKRLKLNVVGIILNNFEQENFMHQDNLKTLEKICDIKVLGIVKRDAKAIEFFSNGLEAIYE